MMKKVRYVFQKIAGIGTVIALLFTLMASTAHADTPAFKEEIVQFQSGGVTLEGTLLVPTMSGPHPAVVLVHGSNTSSREKYRVEAEMFANEGIAAFIYDKRADGFTTSRAGSRSYSVLAGDVNAAVSALGARSDINAEFIGLWGISEGAWVSSLAASDAKSKAAFLITVGAAGVMPVQQQSWQLVNRLQDQGISSNGMIRSVSQHGLQLAVSAGLFAEAMYNPIPVFEQLKQPVLAIWGSNDRVEPPLESSQLIREALERGGNQHYTIRYLEGADHLLHVTPDDIDQSEAFPAGYSEAMTSWVKEVMKDRAPKPSVIGAEPRQDHLSPAGIGQLSWYQSAWLQLSYTLILLVTFAGYLIAAFVRFARKRGMKPDSGPERKYKLVLSASAFIAILGFILYFGYLMSSGAKQLAPVVMDRTLVWMVLQLFTLTALAAAGMLAKVGWVSRATESAAKVESSLMLTGALLFVPWALYWQLLMP